MGVEGDGRGSQPFCEFLTEGYQDGRQMVVELRPEALQTNGAFCAEGSGESLRLARAAAAARPQVKDSSWLMPELATLSRPEAPCCAVWLQAGCVSHRQPSGALRLGQELDHEHPGHGQR